VNGWLLLLLVGAGLILGIFALGPYLQPNPELQARQRFLEVMRTWEGIRDLRAEIGVLRPGEPRLNFSLLYLAGLALRLEIQEPEELRGEVYALRAIPEGWLLVHFRPKLGLGLEAHFPDQALTWVLSDFEGFSMEKAKITWPEENVVRFEGLSGAFAEAELRLDPETKLPVKILLKDRAGNPLELSVEKAEVNVGLELRELLLLDPFPTRWIRIPFPEGGA
jgi:hypothetical protein